jgi:hypothetical protein
MKAQNLVASFIIVLNSSAATQVLAPNLETAEGAAGQRLGNGANNAPSRSQVIFEARLFNKFTGPGSISEIQMRSDGAPGGGPFSTSVELEITMSTTQKAETTLSPIYGLNTGFDESIVFSRSRFLMSSSSSVSGGPNVFDINIPLSTPYVYDPSLGNLLVDIRAYDPGSSPQLDAAYEGSFSGPRDGIGGVRGDVAVPSGGNGPIGFVMKLTFEPVPEPRTVTLLFVGTAAWFVARRKGIS